jgi:3-oxoacyl-[acyl-carrier protein] reductase
VAAAGERIDILVNLAGGMVARKTLAEMDEAFFDQVMELNLKSAFLVTKAALPKLGKGSSIVNVASLAGRDGGGPGASIYATSKGALMTLTRSWAKEMGPQGIRVNAVCPGLIGTSFHDVFSKPEGRAAVAGNTPLRREGHPDDVADLIAYLASDEASFLTGTCVDINGGLAFS